MTAAAAAAAAAMALVASPSSVWRDPSVMSASANSITSMSMVSYI